MPEQRNRAVWDLVASHALFTQGLKAAGAAMGQFANIVKSTQFIVGASAAAMGVAFFKAAQKGVAMAAILDASMREVATLIPQTTEQLGFMRDALIDMSTRVPQAPELLSAGVYQAISAGITDTTEALRVVETSAKAAVAGLTDTFTAVDAITTVLNAYQLEASEAARVSDILFKTVEQGKVRFPELAQNIGNVVTSASLAGVEFEQVAAAIATVTKFGIGAAEATTSLNRAILSIIKPTKAQRDAAAELGIELSAAALAEKGLVGFVQELNAATEGQVDALARVFPNIRAFRSISILAGKGIDEYNRILLETENSAGSAGAAFDKINGSLSNQAQLLKNKVNVLFQNLGAKILPPLVAILENVNGVLTTQETRWREAAEAAGDYEGVLKSLREEQIEQLSQQVDDLQKRLSAANQVFVSGLSRGPLPYGQGIVPEEIQQALKDIDATILDFNGNLEGSIDLERELIAEAIRLRDFIRKNYEGSEAIVASLNTRIVQRQAELKDARLLLEVETKLGDRARDRTEAEIALADIQRRARRAREIAPDSDLTKILQKQERLAVANVDLEKVQNELKRVGLITTKANTEELEKLAEQYETGAANARVLLQMQTDQEQIAGGEVVQQTLKVEAQERIAKWLREELEIRKLILTIFTKTAAATEAFVADTDNLVKALTALVTLGGQNSLESLAQLVPEIAEALKDLNFDNILAQDSVDRLANFVDLVAEGLENLNNFKLELPEGVDLLTQDEANLRTRIAAFKQYANTITATFEDATSAALEIDAALKLFKLDLEDLDDETRAWVESWLDVGDGITKSQKKILDLIDDISFAINSALALADAFGVSSQEINTLIRNVDLLGRSIERIVLSGGLSFQSAFGAGAALLSIGANLIGGGGESPEEKARREAIEKNTEAIEDLAKVTNQLAVIRDVRSSDFDLLADAAQKLSEAPLLGEAIRVAFGKDREKVLAELGVDLDAVVAAAKRLGIDLDIAELGILEFRDELVLLAEAARAIDLSILRDTYDGMQEWGRLVAEVFDEELTPELEFDLLRDSLRKAIPLDLLENLQKLGDDAPLAVRAIADAFDFGELFGDADDPATVQAWEDFSRYLVENFDKLFKEGFFGDLTTDEALKLLSDIDSNTDAMQELLAGDDAAGAAIRTVAQQNKVTTEQADIMIALDSTRNFYLMQIRDNTLDMLDVIAAPGLTPPSREELDRYGTSRDGVYIENLDLDVNVSGTDEPTAVAVAVVDEVDKRLGTLNRTRTRGTGAAPRRNR